MDLVKIIFDSFGGREMERIFGNYFLILLILKQLLFSLFSVPADNSNDLIPAENEQVSYQIVEADSTESLEKIQVFQLLWTLAELESEETPAPEKEIYRHK